ncbi:hypothetical protein OXPF_01050 [Oxobacter pfennigii]|uniref:DUF6431 domain-containing protein n=2 Tax=Oxobacter pfennigii TaxID=36849 RepID=A0A0P8WU93_9CLOT|nr:hypothetical protein OXPF_01050 [Oxobacter pfennigii]
MQNIFLCNSKPKAFREANGELFPEAPLRCMFEDCQMPVRMKKHGFYKRYIITYKYSGYICIRRYICPCCGRTVSFLPSFLVPYFQYAFPYILAFLNGYFKRRQSLRKYVEWFKRKKDGFNRRHFRYYINRIFLNRSLIQYYLNLTDQDMIANEDAMASRLFAKSLLEKIHAVSPQYLSWNFFNVTGKSILAPVQMIS